MKRVRVLIIDDSAVIRRSFRQGLADHPNIEVVGTAPDPYVARDLILKLKPDVLTLDIEMPRMDGLTFLGKLMVHYPMPVIVVSSVAPSGSQAALEAMRLGAVEVVCKPNASYSAQGMLEDLAKRVIAVASVNVTPRKPEKVRRVPRALARTTNQLLAIGASTGGTQAIEHVLSGMPANLPGTLIVQHMPPAFTNAWARRLDKEFPFEVREAQANDSLSSGRVLIAPGNKHMMLKRSGASYFVDVRDGPRVNFHRPSVDVTFRSVAQIAGGNAIGVILTGMGNDGAKGLQMMRQAGSRTIGQDEATSVVYGMPKTAHELGAVETQLPLNKVPDHILSLLQQRRRVA